MAAYYSENEPYAAQWLRNLIAAGLIAPGEVDERSIVDVRPADLAGFDQCHFFAGLGGWSYALRLAGWPDSRPVWTGSCPCQPFSVAGQGKGEDDARDLWPVWGALIRECRPPVVFGEQVAAAIGKHWLDRMRADLEGSGYAVGAAVLPACAVGAPHRRDRLWFVADAADARRGSEDARAACRRESACVGEARSTVRVLEPQRDGRSPVADANGAGIRDQSGRRGGPSGSGPWIDRNAGESDVADADLTREGEGWEQRGRQFGGAGSDPWAGDWLTGADGKARRVEPGIRLLAHGIPNRVGQLRAYGNAIVPQVAAAFIQAYLDTMNPTTEHPE